MMVFPVLIPGQNFLFPGTGREITKCHGKGRGGKFGACIPGNHGKREFPLTPGSNFANGPVDPCDKYVLKKIANLLNDATFG